MPATSKTEAVTRSETARQLAIACANIAADNKGRDLLVLDLRSLTSVVDYFVICSGTSRRQMHAIADDVDRMMKEHGETKIGIEGYGESHWILLDYGDIVVHVFDDETRRFYDLESLWGGAEQVPL